MNPPRPATFPFVDCPEHGRQRSYVVCRHVTDAYAEPAHVALATDTEMGKILCDLPDHDLLEGKVLCAAHVREYWGVG